MAISVTQIHPLFAARIDGADLTQPFTPETFAPIQAAMDEYGALVFKGPTLTQEQQITFAQNFGTLEGDSILKTDRKKRIAPQLADISNLDEKNKVFEHKDRRRMFNLGNQLWHTDSSFKRIPAKYSGLHAHSVTPEGGETQIADTRAAYDALPQRIKDQIEDLVAEHSIFCSRAKLGFTEFTDEERAALPPVHRPLVRTHPASNRKAIYVASHCSHILGMEIPDGKMLLRELIEHCTQCEFVYTHTWEVGDMVIWDNRCTLHRGRPFDEANHRRDMRRATVMDDDPAMEHRDAA